MSNKCVHEWYYRIVDIVSWQFFCIRCGEKLSMDKFSNHATELEKNADALTARIAELEAEQRWHVVKECNDVATPIDVALRKRIAELEAFIDQLIEAGDAVINAEPMWIAEEDKWDALVKDWKERKE